MSPLVFRVRRNQLLGILQPFCRVAVIDGLEGEDRQPLSLRGVLGESHGLVQMLGRGSLAFGDACARS